MTTVPPPRPWMDRDEATLDIEGIGHRRYDPTVLAMLEGDAVRLAFDIDLVGGPESTTAGITDGIEITDPDALLDLARLCLYAAQYGKGVVPNPAHAVAASHLELAILHLGSARTEYATR